MTLLIRIYKASRLVIKKLLKIFPALFIAYLLLAFIFSREGSYSFTFERASLEKEVEKVLQNIDGRYGIFIKNLSTQETFAQKEQEIFESGSLYKIWVMAAAFEQIQKGQISESEELIADIPTLNRKFNLEKAEFQTGRIEFSIGSALHQMITISHNYAALALLDKIGIPSVPTKITAKGTAEFLEKLYKGEMINQEYSQKMMYLLLAQTINDRIPKYLPQGTKVAHKTGDIGFFEHDAGIVFSPGGDFIIVVLTETKDPEAAADTTAKISKATYDYFNK